MLSCGVTAVWNNNKEVYNKQSCKGNSCHFVSFFNKALLRLFVLQKLPQIELTTNKSPPILLIKHETEQFAKLIYQRNLSVKTFQVKL